MKNIELKLLVAEDDLDMVFNIIKEAASTQPKLFNQFVVQQGRYKDTKKYLTLRTASKDDLDMELNKIRVSLLELIDQLPEIGSNSMSGGRAGYNIDNQEHANKYKEKQQEFYAENFFYTLDDVGGNSFPELAANTTRLSILARTSVNLLSQYTRLFEDLALKGCDIKMLMIGPDSDATKYVYGDNPEVFYSNAEKTDYYVKKLQKSIGQNFQVRTIKHAPTMSLMVFEKDSIEDSFMVIQLYFLHSLIGRDRPLFKIRRKDRWYKSFFNEFSELWKNGDSWDITKMKKNYEK